MTEDPKRFKITIEQNYPRYMDNSNKTHTSREYSLCFRYTQVVEDFLHRLEELTGFDEQK